MPIINIAIPFKPIADTSSTTTYPSICLLIGFSLNSKTYQTTPVMSKFKDFLVKPWIYVLVLIIGVSFKFYHIDYRYFWLDEISTVEQTSGLNREGIDQLAPVNEIASLDFYKSLVHLNDLNLTLAQQLKGQAQTMNLNPLHYFLLAFWHRLVGDSTFALRFFSVFFFLLTVPFVFLLAKKLFNNNLSGWIAVSLFSVFNYFHYYSHETRYITLTVFLIVASSYFLLEALDRKKFWWWLGYVVTGTMALYASVILGLLLMAHFLFVIVFRRKIFIQFFASIGIVFLLYLPWLLFIVFSFGKVEAALDWQKYFNDNSSFLFLIFMQLSVLAQGFIALMDPVVLLMVKHMHSVSTLIYLLMAVFIIVSIFYAANRMEKKSFYFLLFMFLSSFLFFLSSDLIRSAGSSLVVRYHYIHLTAALFFIAFFLSRKINRKNIFYFTLYMVIAVLGIVSIQKVSQNKTWYYMPMYDFKPVDYIANSENCLVISDFTSPLGNGITAFLMVANAIESENVDVLRTTPDNPDIKEQVGENDYSDIYVIYASEELLKNLEAQFGEQITQIDDPELYNPFYQIDL